MFNNYSNLNNVRVCVNCDRYGVYKFNDFPNSFYINGEVYNECPHCGWTNFNHIKFFSSIEFLDYAKFHKYNNNVKTVYADSDFESEIECYNLEYINENEIFLTNLTKNIKSVLNEVNLINKYSFSSYCKEKKISGIWKNLRIFL